MKSVAHDLYFQTWTKTSPPHLSSPISARYVPVRCRSMGHSTKPHERRLKTTPTSNGRDASKFTTTSQRVGGIRTCPVFERELRPVFPFNWRPLKGIFSDSTGGERERPSRHHRTFVSHRSKIRVVRRTCGAVLGTFRRVLRRASNAECRCTSFCAWHDPSPPGRSSPKSPTEPDGRSWNPEGSWPTSRAMASTRSRTPSERLQERE